MFALTDNLPRIKTNIRFLHAAAGADAVDIYANGNKLSSNVKFSNITPYEEVTPDKYEIRIYKSGTYDTPLFTENLELVPNEILTICIVLLESTPTLLKLKDATNASINMLSFLRFINLSPNAPLLTLSLPGGDTLFNGVEYLETTGYYTLSSGLYNFLLDSTDGSIDRSYIPNVTLGPDTHHTIYILGLTDDKPRLGSLVVEDGITGKN